MRGRGLGMDPNWLSPIFFNIAGGTCSSTTNSSAILDKSGVNDIGRRSLSTSFTGFCFGIGTSSIVFQDGNRRSSLKEQFRMSLTGSVRRLAFSFISHAGMPSGPEAFLELSDESFM